MPEWRAKLKGSGIDLRRAAHLFRTAHYHVIEERSDFYLVSPELLQVETGEADERAKDIVARMNAVMLLEDPGSEPVVVHGVQRTDQGPGAPCIVTMSPVVMTGRGALFAELTKAQSEEGEPSPSEAERWINAATRDPAVAKVLRFLSSRSTPSHLYKAYEVLREDMGGESELRLRRWATRDALSRFRFAIQDEQTSGEAARHAIPAAGAPRNQWTIERAEEFLRRLVRVWLNFKVAAQSPPSER